MPNATLPDHETAYSNLFEGIAQRVFFGELANRGYAPTTQKQAQDMLELAGKLRLVEDEAAVKQANDSYDPFAAANAALDGVLANAGYSSVQKQAADERAVSIKNAAREWAQDPTLYNSVIAVRSHEAEQLAAHLRQQGLLR